MSLSGRYKAENNDDYLSHYYIVMDVGDRQIVYLHFGGIGEPVQRLAYATSVF